MVEAVSEAFVVCWSHSPGGSFSGSPSMASIEMALFLLQNVSGICDVLDHASLLANKPFLPERF